jgi:hypothetical protein
MKSIHDCNHELLMASVEADIAKRAHDMVQQDHQEWLYKQPVYSEYCAERCIPPNDPYSMDLFLYDWTPGYFNDGICSVCGEATPAVWVTHWGDSETPDEHHFAGTECCHADMYTLQDGDVLENAK